MGERNNMNTLLTNAKDCSQNLNAHRTLMALNYSSFDCGNIYICVLTLFLGDGIMVE